MILNCTSSSELLEVLRKFGLSDNNRDVLPVIAAVIQSITKYVSETEELLGRRRINWHIADYTDLECYINLIANDRYLGSGKDVRYAKDLSRNSKQLLQKIRNAKNGKSN